MDLYAVSDYPIQIGNKQGIDIGILKIEKDNLCLCIFWTALQYTTQLNIMDANYKKMNKKESRKIKNEVGMLFRKCSCYCSNASSFTLTIIFYGDFKVKSYESHFFLHGWQDIWKCKKNFKKSGKYWIFSIFGS